MHAPQVCMYKMPETGCYCGAAATRQTAVNEDPWGRGYWCETHAPAPAVSIIPPDPNRDYRVPLNDTAASAPEAIDAAKLFTDGMRPSRME